jgi:hypothetical protein
MHRIADVCAAGFVRHPPKFRQPTRIVFAKPAKDFGVGKRNTHAANLSFHSCI